MSIKEWFNQPVKIGIFLKIIICFNIIVLAYCYLVCSVRTTQDEEHLEYDNYLENRIEIQTELIDLQRQLINVYKCY